MSMTQNDLMDLNYRLADVLVYIKGYKAAVLSTSGGNKKEQSAKLDLCDWIESNLTDSKRIVSRSIKPLESEKGS